MLLYLKGLMFLLGCGNAQTIGKGSPSRGLQTLPRKTFDYKGTMVEEMDLDTILSRKPQLVLVDELAHTNAPGSRHAKRYQDVLELLDNGIDVFTTLNVQHLESRAETVAQITGSIVRETVPDSIFEIADEVEVIDISPTNCSKRLAEGKVYAPERSKRAVDNFFRKGNLTALREMSLRLTAERVDQQLREYNRSSGFQKRGNPERVSLSVLMQARNHFPLFDGLAEFHIPWMRPGLLCMLKPLQDRAQRKANSF